MKAFLLTVLLWAPAAQAITLNPGESVWLKANEETLVSCVPEAPPRIRCGMGSEPSCAANYSGGSCVKRGGRDVGRCIQGGVDEAGVASCKCF